jgi:hypothetical protein
MKKEVIMNTPANIVRLLENNSLPEVLELTRGIRAQALTNLHREIELPLLQEATEIIKENAHIELNRVQLHNLLLLYPIQRGNLIDSGLDTDAVGSLLNAVAQYFLGCDWPDNGDQVPYVKFLAALRQAAPIMRPLL